MKRVNAPSSWMLDKLGGKYAPKPSSGPHRLSECIPLCILLRRKLKYASTTKELKYILGNNIVKLNGVIRADRNFPVGFMDVISIGTTNEHFRLLYNSNRKFVLKKIAEEEALYRLCKVVKKKVEIKNVPYLYTQDGSTFRYCDPEIKIGDVVKVGLSDRKVISFMPFRPDMKVFITKGKNMGCVGIVSRIEKHMGGYDIAYVVDSSGRSFATRACNAFVIGDADSSLVLLPKGDGIKVSELEKSNLRYGELVDTKADAEE